MEKKGGECEKEKINKDKEKTGRKKRKQSKRNSECNASRRLSSQGHYTFIYDITVTKIKKERNETQLINVFACQIKDNSDIGFS